MHTEYIHILKTNNALTFEFKFNISYNYFKSVLSTGIAKHAPFSPNQIKLRVIMIITIGSKKINIIIFKLHTGRKWFQYGHFILPTC